MKEFYSYTVDQLRVKSGKRIEVMEHDIDLYYHMALSMYEEIESHNLEGKTTVCILPVGPVFQYRRFISLLKRKPLDLSNLYIFFMDEYLKEDGQCVDTDNPLSFKGFINRELIAPMPESMNLRKEQIFFPEPDKTDVFDAQIVKLGGIDFCHAGVGIVGHLAFNEPVSASEISAEQFVQLPTRVVHLTKETITINSNTALRGAYEEIPETAVTIGMKQIVEARKLIIYFNRPWQSAVCRKALLMEPTPEFPVTLARKHPDIIYIMTELVAARPDFALR